MKKKGYLFSIITLLLLVSLLLLSSAYIKKVNAMKDMNEISFLANRLNYMESDIATDFLGLLNITLTNITKDKTNNDMILKFDSFGSVPISGISAAFSNYETFIEGTYLSLTNTEILLDDFNQEFSFTGYNTSFIFTDGSQYISIVTQDYLKINSIDVEISAVGLGGGPNCPSSDPAGDLTIHAIIREGANILLDCTRTLDSTNTNCDKGRFRIATGGAEAHIYLCSIDGNPGTLRLETIGITADVTKLEYNYEAIPKKVYLKANASISIDPNLGSIGKGTKKLILGKETYETA